jgi:hypothetical protein
MTVSRLMEILSTLHPDHKVRVILTGESGYVSFVCEDVHVETSSAYPNVVTISGHDES